jgi:hypothetical protein
MAIDWNVLGTAIGGIVVGIGGYFTGKGKRTVAAAEDTAQTNVVNLLRQEVERLSGRVTAMEGREGKLIRHIYRLEGLMRAKGLEPPHFDVDGAVE